MDILIPIETSSRELLYKIYLCHLLARKGFTCYLGTKSSINKLMLEFNGYIYIDKGYHFNVSEKLYEIIKNRNGMIISLDDEGAVDYPDNSTLLNIRYTKKLFSESDFVFLWGEKQFKVVQSNILNYNKVMVTGHPKFELLKKDYRLFYRDDVKNIENRYSNFILINTNMGHGNNIKGDEHISGTYRDRIPNIDKSIAFDKKKRDMFVSLVFAISKELGKTIIYRPHPEEDNKYYKNAFKALSNVHVVYKGSVIPWLLASEVMIHPDCTTGIESILLGKKSISFLPERYEPNFVTKLPLEVSNKFYNIRDIIDFLKEQSIRTETININDYPVIEDSFSLSKNSSQLIVDKISEYLTSPLSSKPNQIRFIDKMHLSLGSFKRKLKYKSGVLQKNKLKGFSSKEIRRISSLVIEVNPDCRETKAKKISSGLFRFS
jgi:surface carbohydrate biosynthesis protein